MGFATSDVPAVVGDAVGFVDVVTRLVFWEVEPCDRCVRVAPVHRKPIPLAEARSGGVLHYRNYYEGYDPHYKRDAAWVGGRYATAGPKRPSSAKPRRYPYLEQSDGR